MFRIATILCAAGSSSRMPDHNKLLLDYEGTTFIRHITKELLETQLEQIIVVTGFESSKIKAALDDLSSHITFVNNPAYQSGQTSSIQAGLLALPTDIDSLMINLGDMPLISSSQYNDLIDHFKNQYKKGTNLITRPMNEKVPGHPVIFSNSLMSAMLSCTSSDGCRSVIKDHHDYFTEFSTQEDSYFKDIDTPTDYLKMKATN